MLGLTKTHPAAGAFIDTPLTVTKQNECSNKMVIGPLLVRKKHYPDLLIDVTFHQPVSLARRAICFLSKAMLKAAVGTPFTSAFIDEIKTTTSNILLPCIHVMPKVAFFPSRARSCGCELETHPFSICTSLPLPLLGDIIAPILFIRNGIARSLCCFCSTYNFLCNCIWS